MRLIIKIIAGAGTKSLKVDCNKITISAVTSGQFNDYIRVTQQEQVEPSPSISMPWREAAA